MSRADRRASRVEAEPSAPQASEPLLAARPEAPAEPAAEAPAAAPSAEVDLLAEASREAASLREQLAAAQAALAEAREELKLQRQTFDFAWADREEHFRREHNALALETKLAEAAAQVLDLAPKARKAAATFTLLIAGERKRFTAGDLIPDTADLSALPAWAFEAA